ncbi:XTP/dITP diphosphohydrolase [Pseudonocardia thermophila]|jgi:Protein containing tetrapyrrole methyltransferase domain and MazG-like (predicted pyrophosphatase) domain|uniref:XTP/dITP diphosphohydrolase n=1 Tax=Pseudonocardia thermophila TaxID=1848 RepID=A0A1M6RME0_PSETH|nr:MazG family protein [Pseudonocardia thermophila]SHK33614.1 XTP/dITP diphosphohydrolase [Pseudonocardia thermophila]
MATTVVLAGGAAVLPAAALPALRAAARVFADHTVPDELCSAAGAQRLTDADRPGVDDVVLTCDTAAGPAGAALLDAVRVMDRLRSPGGCPWDAKQTHESLLQYLVEECYELYQAIEDGNRADVREELGDVLLQVLFHSRIATEHPTDAFGIDEVARDLVTKLVERHPHVFAGTERMITADQQEARWDELKRAQKKRESSIDGVPLGQPAVALAAKLASRTTRAGLPAELLPEGPAVGERLFAVAAAAKLAGIDPEAELRGAARRFADRVRAAEEAARADGQDPSALDADGWKRYWPA